MDRRKREKKNRFAWIFFSMHLRWISEKLSEDKIQVSMLLGIFFLSLENWITLASKRIATHRD